MSNLVHLRVSFPEITADTSVTDALVSLYRDNQRNVFADPIKYWVMTPDCLDKLRKETTSDQYMNLHSPNDADWRFMDIPITILATRQNHRPSFVEMVY